MHPRQAIRAAVVTAIRPAATDAGDRVLATRKAPWPRRNLPAIAVYTFEESVDRPRSTDRPRRYLRQLKLSIVLAAEGDDAADALDEQVEAAIERDTTFGALAQDAWLSSTSIEAFDDSDQGVVVLTLTYDVDYWWSPDVAEDGDLVPFERGGVTTDVQHGTQADADRSRALIELEGDQS